jgi:phosphate-selective porin OprO/OprP
VDRAIGLRGQSSGQHWFAAAGVFGESVDANKDNDEGFGVAGRFIVAPIIEDGHVLHLGVRGAHRKPSASSKSVRIKDETTHQSNLNVIDTGEIMDVDATTLYGGEAAWAYGPFSVFGEYSAASIDRDSGEDLTFAGWHAAATLSLTGESRAAAYRLDAGEFKRLTPAQDFSLENGGWGAWETAVRLASLDLNDEEIVGGDEKVLTTALNWYVNSTIRFMAEWTHILDTDGSTELREAAEGLDIFQIRSQFTF